MRSDGIVSAVKKAARQARRTAAKALYSFAEWADDFPAKPALGGSTTSSKAIDSDREILRSFIAADVRALEGSGVTVWEYHPRCSVEQDRTGINLTRASGGPADPQAPVLSLADAILTAVASEDVQRVKEALEAGLRDPSSSTFQFEYRAHTAAAAPQRWRVARIDVVRAEDGTPRRMFGIGVDVTRLKHAEAEKGRETEQLELATKLSRIITWSIALKDGRIEGATASLTNFWEPLGYEVPAEPPDFASTANLVIVPEDRGLLMQAAAACVRGETERFEIELRVRHKDGSVHWQLARGLVTRASTGTPLCLLGTSVDITELKNAQDSARTAGERLELALVGSKVFTWDFQMDDGTLENSRVQYTNAWELHGYDPTEDPRRYHGGLASLAWPKDRPWDISMLIHPDDRARSAAAIREVLYGSRPTFDCEYRVLHADGTYRSLLGRGVVLRNADGQPARFVGASIDITDRKRVQDALRASEERFRGVFENASVAMLITDMDGNLLDCNERLCEFLGRTHEQMLGRNFREFTEPEELAQDIRQHDLVVSDEVRSFARDKRYRKSDGSHVWAHVSISVIERDPTGKPTRKVAILQDNTKRKALEVELQRTKDLLEVGVRGSKLGVFAFDMPDGQIESAHLTLINVWETLGYDPLAAPKTVSPAFMPAVHLDDIARVRAAVSSYLLNSVDHFEVEYRVVHQNGSIQWRLARGVAYRDRHGTPVRFIGSSYDITTRRRLEEDLRRAKDRLELAVRGTDIGIWEHDIPNGDFSRMFEPENSTLINVWEALGFDGPEHDNAASLAHPDELEATLRGIHECLNGSVDKFEAERRGRHKNGEWRWFLTRGFAVRDAAGVPIRFIGTSIDITDRIARRTSQKLLEESLRKDKERLELGIRAAHLSLMDYDMPDGTLLGMIPTVINSWEELGYEPREAKDFEDHASYFMHPDDRPWVRPLTIDYLAGKRGPLFEVEHRVTHRDGSIRWRLTRGVAVRRADGTPTRFIVIAVDITKLKRIEAELQRAIEAAEVADRAKDRFLANVSHEIRTPLNAILGMTEIALEAGRSGEHRQSWMNVRSAGTTLLTLIDELLDFSKMVSGRIALDESEFAVSVEIGETVRVLAPQARRKGLELRYRIEPDVPAALLGDAGRLRQVLMNLLGNAIKFTAEGEIAVSVGLAPDAGPEGVVLIFTVRDTGIGIAREKQSAIFRAFEQEDSSTTRRYGGTGLGLTIAAQIVSAMGGHISVESEPGRGSTFVFTARFKSSSNLDLATTPALESRVESLGAESFAAATTPLRILVAEDNELNVAVITGLLRRRGHRVRVVPDGRAALTQALEGGYDLLMLDLHMPEIDGFDVARAIRERERSRGGHLPIVALTCRSSAGDRELCRAAGMDEFVTKPIEGQVLWKAIARLTEAFPPSRSSPSLLDSRAILRACGGEATALERLRDVFRRTLPEGIDRTRAALEARDLPGVRDAAHTLYGTVAAFSTIAGEVVASLEEAALRGEAASCSEIFVRLASMCTQLLGETGVLAMEDLSPDPLRHRLDEERDAPVAAGERVLDPDALWAACEGDGRVLRSLCMGLQAHLPTRLQELEQALSAVDSVRLHDVAYKLCAMLPAFSTTGGEVASELAGLAAAGHVDGARPLVARLSTVARQLLLQTENLSVESLRHP